MMKKKINYGKLFLAAFLTVLIWVWADLSKTEEYEVTNATIQISKASNSNVWISFAGKGSVALNSLKLVGSSSKIANALSRQRNGEKVFDFVFDEDVDIDSGNKTINLVEFFRNNKAIHDLGLSISSCKPKSIELTVEKLEERPLAVSYFNNDNIRTEATITPENVTIAVPTSWAEPAKVKLTSDEAKQAKTGQIIKKYPFIELSDGQVRRSLTEVEISLSGIEDKAKGIAIISPAKLMFMMSPLTAGKYKPVVRNIEDLGSIQIKATAAAENAYKNQSAHMLLYIDDEDIKKEGVIPGKIIYYFPQKYVCSGEIDLDQEEKTAEFELIKLEVLDSGAD